MVRTIALLIGAAFVAALSFALFGTVKTAITDPAPESAEHVFHVHPEDIGLKSAGLLGKFDLQQVQRGFQVYKEVCSACHSLKYVIEQPTINPDTGEAATRKNVPADPFPSPFANEVAARAANNNALPPDLSLVTKAREDGGNYVHALMMGYRDQPAELVKDFPGSKTPKGLHYNPAFANLNIAMPPPLTQDGQITYADGTKATKDQMARDVAAFLTWTAEPNLESRHGAGLATVVFLAIFLFLVWGAYQNVWRDQKH